MGRSIEISGRWLLFVYIAVSLAAAVPLLAVVVLPLDSFADVALALLIGSVFLALLVGLWRWQTGRTWEHSGRPEDITWDPYADPGQAAKHSWLKAVNRLPDGDDEDD